MEQQKFIHYDAKLNGNNVSRNIRIPSAVYKAARMAKGANGNKFTIGEIYANWINAGIEAKPESVTLYAGKRELIHVPNKLYKAAEKLAATHSVSKEDAICFLVYRGYLDSDYLTLCGAAELLQQEVQEEQAEA